MVGSIAGLSPVRLDANVRVFSPKRSSPEQAPPPTLPASQPLHHAASKATQSSIGLQAEARSRVEIESAARQTKLAMDLFEIKGEFEIDEENNRIKVTVVNTKTGRILQRIPVFELRGVYKAFRDNLGLDGPISI